MNNIPEKYSFEPNKNTLENWLKTRKKKIVAHGYVLNGFFSTASFVWDATFFIVGLTIELIIFGFFMSCVDLDYLGNWIALPVIIILDIIFILLVHQNKQAKVKYENALPFLSENENPMIHEKIVNVDQLKSHFNLGKYNILSFIGIFLEMFSCVVKIYLLDEAYGLYLEPISVGIVVGYVVQTYFYINSGGYFIWGVITNLFMNSQYSKYRKYQGNTDEYVSKSLDIIFSSIVKILPTSDDASKNTLFKIEVDSKANDDNKFGYKISVKGIPSDYDLVDFAMLQETREARKEVMFFAHKLQLSKYASVS